MALQLSWWSLAVYVVHMLMAVLITQPCQIYGALQNMSTLLQTACSDSVNPKEWDGGRGRGGI